MAAYSEINAYAGSQLLAHGYWALALQDNIEFWGDGTSNIPSSPPLLANFNYPGQPTYFNLTAWSNNDEPGNAIGYQYTGTITYLSDVPNPVPIPAALPLIPASLGAMGFLGWRRRKVVVAG
jgi:hypothetical protein